MKEYFFANWLPYHTASLEEMESIKAFLLAWKYYILNLYPQFEFINEQYIDRIIPLGMGNSPLGTLALKLCLKGPGDYIFDKTSTTQEDI